MVNEPFLITLLNRLDNEGVLTPLYCSGLISKRVQTIREVYLFVDAELKTGTSKSKTVAVTRASEVFKVTEKTIWQCLRDVHKYTPPEELVKQEKERSLSVVAAMYIC